MKSVIRVALMAVALFLAAQGQPRADEDTGPKCPCDFTTDVLPLVDWLGRIECIGGKLGEQTQLARVPEAYGSPSLVAQLYLGGDCLRFDENAQIAGKERVLSRAQMRACSREITDYAQELKDQKAWWVNVIDKGCDLK